jgi:plasmid stability protein
MEGIMKTITIRGIDEDLAVKIRERAIKTGKSINQLVLNLLKAGLGLTDKKEFPAYHDLDSLAGTWSAEEADQFMKNIEDLETIDAELWQ